MRKDKKGNPTLYKVDADPNVRLYNMEAPLTPDIVDVVKKAMEPDFPNENTETGAPFKNLREVFDEYRAESKNNGLSRDEVQGTFDSIRYSLERMGYRGYEHLGGARTGAPAHNVRIYWFPEEDVSISRVDPAEYQIAQKPAPEQASNIPTERSLLQAEKVRALHEQTAFTGLKSGDDVLKKIVNDNTEIINSVEQFGAKKLSLETPEPEPEYESFDDIYRQAQQFKTDHDNIMRMIEAGEIDTISAAAYKAELAGLDPDSLDNGFLELQNCLLGI
jgi:hypothetical protein